MGNRKSKCYCPEPVFANSTEEPPPAEPVKSKKKKKSKKKADKEPESAPEPENETKKKKNKKGKNDNKIIIYDKGDKGPCESCPDDILAQKTSQNEILVLCPQRYKDLLDHLSGEKVCGCDNCKHLLISKEPLREDKKTETYESTNTIRSRRRRVRAEIYSLKGGQIKWKILLQNTPDNDVTVEHQVFDESPGKCVSAISVSGGPNSRSGSYEDQEPTYAGDEPGSSPRDMDDSKSQESQQGPSQAGDYNDTAPQEGKPGKDSTGEAPKWNLVRPSKPTKSDYPCRCGKPDCGKRPSNKE